MKWKTTYFLQWKNKDLKAQKEKKKWVVHFKEGASHATSQLMLTVSN